jgi:hypothetical protein
MFIVEKEEIFKEFKVLIFFKHKLNADMGDAINQCTLDLTRETALSRFSGGWVMMNCSFAFMLLSYFATNL